MNTKYTYGELGVFFFGDNKWTIKQISKRRLRKKNKRLGKFLKKKKKVLLEILTRNITGNLQAVCDSVKNGGVKCLTINTVKN